MRLQPRNFELYSSCIRFISDSFLILMYTVCSVVEEILSDLHRVSFSQDKHQSTDDK